MQSYIRSTTLALALGGLASPLGQALAPTIRSLPPADQLQTGVKTRGKGGRKSVATKLRNWWAPVRTTSCQARNPNDPRQAALISAASAKRLRRATKLAKAALSYR